MNTKKSLKTHHVVLDIATQGFGVIAHTVSCIASVMFVAFARIVLLKDAASFEKVLWRGGIVWSYSDC